MKWAASNVPTEPSRIVGSACPAGIRGASPHWFLLEGGPSGPFACSSRRFPPSWSQVHREAGQAMSLQVLLEESLVPRTESNPHLQERHALMLSGWLSWRCRQCLRVSFPFRDSVPSGLEAVLHGCLNLPFNEVLSCQVVNGSCVDQQGFLSWGSGIGMVGH